MTTMNKKNAGNSRSTRRDYAEVGIIAYDLVELKGRKVTRASQMPQQDESDGYSAQPVEWGHSR